MMKLLTIIGTRPEAVKMAPVMRELQGRPGIRSLLCSTGQHRELIQDQLDVFGLVPDFHLHLMEDDQPLNILAARATLAVDALLASEKPDRVVVHGDTCTALAAAQAAHGRRIPVAHVEAGLRTYDPNRPWPEEHHRRAVDLIADQLFAPTAAAAHNLAHEQLTGSIYVTGNSGIDALHLVIDHLAADAALRARCDSLLPPRSDAPLILATIHRRESIGAGIGGICAALASLADRELAEIVIPVHPNPAVGPVITELLGGRAGVHLLPSLPHPALVRLMQRADLILTDSGGIQEEAPSLGKFVLVAREVTERPEAIHAGSARLVGTDAGRIVAEAEAALARSAAMPLRPVLPNPYGDGRAAARIVAGLLGEPFEAFDAGPTVTSAGAPLRLAV